MNTNRPKPVLAIALDAAEPSLVERWMKDGTLPTLNLLRSKGAYGRLKSSSEWLTGSPWPTFYTGTNPGEHGLYESKQWQAERMQYAPVSPDWLPLSPFYRHLGRELRVISIDIPLTYSPEPFNGIEICGWLTYDTLGLPVEGKPVSYPTTEIDHLRDMFGLEPVLITSEGWGVQKIKSLFRIRDQLIQATHRTGELAKTLMIHEKWDLFMLALAAPHRGGHKLWDPSGTYGRVGTGDHEEFSHTLQDIYIACDKVVGQLIEAVTDDTKIIVFSLHGMRPNTNRYYLLPKILPHILARKSKYSQESNKKFSSFQERIKEYVPSIWRSIARTPNSFIYKLLNLYRSKFNTNLQKNVSPPAFILKADLNGYIRINLRGRERDGIVEPGEDYNQLCSAIIDDLKTFVDVDTGEPVVVQVLRSDELFKSGSRLKLLPDLIVQWTSIPTMNQRTTVSNRYPSLSISTPKRNLDGRSGNHSSEGFLIAVGNGMPHNSQIDNGGILDLAPTICALLGVHKPSYMRGNSLWTANKEI